MTSAAVEGQKSGSVFVLLLAIMASGFLTRLLPLSISQYPYNNDSLIECGMAKEIVSSRHLEFAPGSPWYGTHGIVTPSFNVLLAQVSSSLGVSVYDVAQLMTALFFIVTVGCVFILARRITGSNVGGIGASTAAVLLGTFVFTTGSAWKESLGICLFVLLFVSFVNRSKIQFRILTFLILGTLAVVHHLVASVAYLAVIYMLVWSWLFAILKSNVTKRQVLDLVTVVPPVLAALVYYVLDLTDRTVLFSSAISPPLFAAWFVLLALVSFAFLNQKSHVKWTFAPLVATGMLALLLIDYSGLFYTYVRSASDSYLILVAASSLLVGLAWFGAEGIIEKRPVFKSVQLGLLVAPLTIILFGLTLGFNRTSHQILYRVFDFADIFVFMGFGFAVVMLRSKSNRRGTAVIFSALACLLLTFPFGYYTSDTLGVRHDTQAYEVDAVYWIDGHSMSPEVVSDERLSVVASSTIWVDKRPSLAYDLKNGQYLWPDMYYVMEDSWTTLGVNIFPYGRAVISESVYDNTLADSDVLYVGGPVEDRLHVFTPSPVVD